MCSHLLKCLDTNAKSGKPQAHVLSQALCIKGAGISFHADLSSSSNPKPPVYCLDQAIQLLRGDEGGCTPTKVQGFEGQAPDWDTGTNFFYKQIYILLHQARHTPFAQMYSIAATFCKGYMQQGCFLLLACSWHSGRRFAQAYQSKACPIEGAREDGSLIPKMQYQVHAFAAKVLPSLCLGSQASLCGCLWQ